MSRLPDDLLRHLREPGRVGPPEGEGVRRGEASNPACRDHLVLFLRPDAEGVVAAAGFQATGCPACLAMASAATELLPGLSWNPGLADAVVAAHHAAYGEPSALHRHALGLVHRAVAQAVGG